MLRIIIVLGAIFGPSLYRALEVELLVSSMTSTPRHAFVETLRNDFILLVPILLLLLVSAASRRKNIAVGCFLVAIFLLSLIFLDVLISQQFGQRLTVSDIGKFGSYSLTYLFDFKPLTLIAIASTLVTFCCAVFCVWRLLQSTRISHHTATALGIVVAVAGILVWNMRETGYVHYRLFQNVISNNQTDLSEFRAYSAEFRGTLSDPFEPICSDAPRLAGPLVIYMVESLSSYHSGFFSGLNDWTPELDKLARENLALGNFLANGFTTEDAELSLLTAEYPIYPPNTLTDGGNTHFAGYWAAKDSVVSAYAANNYDSYFLTTSDLEFSSTGEWADALGFETVHGSEAKFYEGWPRYHFDAAPDAALVERIIDVIQGATVPTLIFAKTASSHHPFVAPDSGIRSEEQVIRYVDRQIGALYRHLSEAGFFETGHLIVLGDHRAMRPLLGQEVDRYGYEKAYTQIPAVVIGPVLAPEPKRVDTQFSQVDIANSLVALADAKACTSPVRGMIWGENASAPKYTLHRRGDHRNQFSVFSGDRLGVVTLNGDRTHFEGADFEENEAADIVQFLNFKRVQADAANSQQ